MGRYEVTFDNGEVKYYYADSYRELKEDLEDMFPDGGYSL